MKFILSISSVSAVSSPACRTAAVWRTHQGSVQIFLKTFALVFLPQVRVLQAVVKDKDVRFQEQIQKHEDELLQFNTQVSNDAELQQVITHSLDFFFFFLPLDLLRNRRSQCFSVFLEDNAVGFTFNFPSLSVLKALRDSQRRIEELEESLRSRSEVLEMLQQELNSADQQKQVQRCSDEEMSILLPTKASFFILMFPIQILTAQFRQMEEELAEAHKLREQEKEQSAMHTEEQLHALRSSLEALEKEKEQTVTVLEAELSRRMSELDRVKASLDESISKGKEEDARVQAELTTLRADLEASERQREEVTKKLEVEVERRVAELHLLQEKLDAVERERQEASQSERDELTRLQTELASLRGRLDAGKEEQEAGVHAKQALEKLWKGLHSLSSEGSEIEMTVPEDPAQVLPVLEARLDNLREEHQDREVRMSQISVTIETLQGMEPEE